MAAGQDWVARLGREVAAVDNHAEPIFEEQSNAYEQGILIGSNPRVTIVPCSLRVPGGYRPSELAVMPLIVLFVGREGELFALR
jgi:hypothetical protein